MSPDGRTHPERELRATWEAMRLPLQIGRADSHAKCRFPARRQWLERMLPAHRAELAAIDCPEMEAWQRVDVVESVSLVFANGYLGNPASYYGHLFLKFNARHEASASYLVDQTVNFGAVDVGDDGPVTYIVKALVGGYDAGFSPVDFFFHHANYGENELRDLWEYRINLSPDQVRYVVSHAWELNRMRYVYRFFHDNCAFRVAELLEVVEGVHAAPAHRPWVVPQAVLQTVAQQQLNGVPLLGDRRLHPSRQTRLYQRFATLSSLQRRLVHEIVERRRPVGATDLSFLPMEQRIAVLDTVMDYYQFDKANPSLEGGRRLAPGYVEALSARLSLPPAEAIQSVHPIKPPDEGYAPGWVQAGIAVSHGGKVTPVLRIRPAYYDALDVSVAQGKHGGLSMADLDLELRDGSLRIHRLDIVAVDSINPAITGLPGDRGKGWKMRVGVEHERIDCSGCWVGRVQGDYSLGKYLWHTPVFAAVSAGAALQMHGRFDGAGFARSGIALLTRLSDAMGFRASHELRRPFDGREASYWASQFEARLAWGKRHDLRVHWEHDNASRLSLGIGVYW